MLWTEYSHDARVTKRSPSSPSTEKDLVIKKQESVISSAIMQKVEGNRDAPSITYIKTTPVRPAPPLSISDWYRWDESQRLDFVSDAQHNPRLSPEITAFFRLAIQDQELGIVTRNNASNALISQGNHDPELASIFRRMVEDPTEDEQWRDYALQFLATSIDWSSDRIAMARVIWRMAESGPNSIPGTALLHLSYIDQRGVVPLPNGYQQRLAELLGDSKADLSTRMTAVSIIGQRKLTAFAPRLRELIEHAPEPALRRTALASLGQMGDYDSLELVQRCMNDKDPLIVAAAKGAEHSLSHSSSSRFSIYKHEAKQP